MENAFVEEVAASLVREFLSKKGLKKTSTTMDEEFPRTALSISNRNELRNILHLQSLYKVNKAKDNPLKTILEIMTNYFLEHTSGTKDVKRSPSFLQNKPSQPRSTENLAFKKSLPDEATCKFPEKNKTETYSGAVMQGSVKERNQPVQETASQRVADEVVSHGKHYAVQETAISQVLDEDVPNGKHYAVQKTTISRVPNEDSIVAGKVKPQKMANG